MSQRINLYTASFRIRRSWLSLGKVAAATLLVAIMGGGNHAWQHYLAVQEAIAARQAEKEVQGEMQRVAALEAEIENLRNDPRLPKDLAEAEALLRLREEILGHLGQGESSLISFTEYLRALARQRTPGIWLTGFNIHDGGKDMEIAGRMLSHPVLPEYLVRLKREKAFEGREFAALEMRGVNEKAAAVASSAQPPADPAGAKGERYIGFTLRSSLEPKREEKR